MAQVPDKITKLIEVFIHELELNKIHINKAILFGSYANGTFNELSDIDLALVSESFKGLNHWQRIEKMTDALYRLFQPIEPRALTPEEWDSGDSMTALYAKTSTLISV